MLNATTMDHIRRKAAASVNQLNEGKSAVEIAAEMYRQNLPGKSERTAMMMAQHTADTVAEYYRSKSAAMENYEVWANNALTTATEGMDDVQAYNHLYQIYVGAVASAELNHAASAEEKEAIHNRMKEDTGRSFAADEVTPESLAQLKEKLAAALKDAGILTTQLNAILEMIRSEDADAQMVLDFGAINEDVMTLLAMQTYLDSKNGLCPEIPANAQLEDIALSVCSAMDTYRVAAQVANGEISEEEGVKLLGILGGVFGVLIAYPIIFTGGILTAAVVFELFGSNLIAGAAGIVMFVAICDPVFYGLKAAGITVGNVTQDLAVATVRLVASGVSMLIGAVARGAKVLWAQIKARKAEIKAESSEQTESQDETVLQPVRMREVAEVMA